MSIELNAATEATVGPIRESLRAAEKIRALRYPDAEATPPSSVLPDLATRQGKVLGFNVTTGAPEAVELPTAFSEILIGGDATGDLYYRSGTGDTARLPIGTTGHVLTVSAGLPAWVNSASTTQTLTNKTLGSGTNVALGSDATGDMYYRAAGGALTRISPGTNGHVLTLTAGIPGWAAAPASWSASATETLTNKTLSTGTVIAAAAMNLGSDATGDIYYRAAGGALTRLAAGTNGHVLTLTAGIPGWAEASGGGGGSTTELIRTGDNDGDFFVYNLTTDGLTEGSGNQIVLANNTLMHFRGVLLGYGAGGNRYTATFEGFIRRGANAASTALFGTPTITKSADVAPVEWSCVIAADATIGGLIIGAGNEVVEATNWKASLTLTQVSIPV